MIGPSVGTGGASVDDVGALLEAAAPGVETAATDGVSLETLRSYLLSIPGIPADLASQISAITADGATVPIPVPSGVARTRTADVHGAPATVLTLRNQAGSLVVWVDSGQLNVVLGPLGDDELLDVARGLR